MKKYNNLLRAITVVMAFGVLKGQEFGSHRLFMTPAVQPSGNINEKEFLEKIIAEYSPVEKNKDYLYDYASFCLQGRKEALAGNAEYDDWGEGEKYIERVIEGIKPVSGFKENLQVKIVRDPSMNACAYEDGTIYVNIGLFANISSEAELAAILGHELGHVALHHNYILYKSYNNYLTGISMGRMTGGLAGLLIRQQARAGLSGHSIKNEENADKYAMERIQKSGYTQHGMVSVFEGFQNQSRLYDSRAGFNKPSPYLKTHPTNEKRIHLVNEAFKEAREDKRNFLVDSVYFCKLKQQCIDESIYVLFNNLRFEDCIELSYKQHLIYPTDKFYLFFLGQSLKRLLLDKPELSNKKFITYRYVIQPASQKITPPLFAYSIFYKNKPADFVYKQSIFYHLGSIYNLKPEEIDALPNKRLTTNDSLEFINNKDALEYFNKVSEKLKCRLCLLNSTVDTPTSVEPPGVTSAESRLEQVPFELHKYLNSDYEKDIFFISRYDQFYISYISLNPTAEENHISNIYAAINASDSLNRKLVLPSQLLFSEKNELTTFFEKTQSNLPDPFETSISKFKVVNSKYYDCKGVFPELSAALNSHKARRVNYLSINKVQRNSGGYMNMVIQLYDYIINCYSLDLKTNTISKYTRNIGDATDTEILAASLEAFSELRKIKAKP